LYIFSGKFVVPDTSDGFFDSAVFKGGETFECKEEVGARWFQRGHTESEVDRGPNTVFKEDVVMDLRDVIDYEGCWGVSRISGLLAGGGSCDAGSS